MAIETIASVDELYGLQPEWLALWQRSSIATPFQSPDWLIPWWEHFGAGELCVAVLREGASVVAVAPFFVSNESPPRLRFIGSGNTDYLDVLVDDHAPGDGAATIIRHLCQSRGWDRIVLDHLRADSPLMRASACPEVLEYVEAQDACPVLSLPGAADEFIEGLPRQLRQNLAYYRRKLTLLGETTFDQAVENNFAELFDALIRLHEARWRTINTTGVLFECDVQNFHRDAAKGLMAHHALRLYGLRFEGNLIACLYGFHHAHRTYYYLGGFDPTFAAFSPGTILIAHAIHEAIHEEATSFDFLSGRENYKYKWGAVDELIYRKQLKHTKRSD